MCLIATEDGSFVALFVPEADSEIGVGEAVRSWVPPKSQLGDAERTDHERMGGHQCRPR
ncbi:hypothetical protein CFIICLFH_2465 [Methylobacterium goesingense]|uniref:Uncharacterized protein n=1 Tax=Methylobacterium goesingense TaxID=243690 RepID=A0ABV2LDA0_9HYPH|nr:hypothetical protein CFIICLFH_2465 [Methylobacterium goesingense]